MTIAHRRRIAMTVLASGVYVLANILVARAGEAAAVEPDLPPVGRSAFDRLVGAGPVPFPFSTLLSRIESGLVGDGLPPVKVVLIPLGRSLQRSAGAPEFFKYPRVVAAVDAANRPGAVPLRDRLFLGFHEKGAVLEVISYNDAAGRFEFQVVRDYRAAGTPQVLYARRSLCRACHQNGAPIFARPLWDETPANPEIARRLSAEKRDFYHVPVTGTDIAYFVDVSTDRANLFSVWQEMWQSGCGQGVQGDACRMQALAAALRYALSAALPPPQVLAADMRALDERWQRNWPAGLAIPNPDIPNRDPLAPIPAAQLVARLDKPAVGNQGDETLAALTHVPAEFEPLQLRAPLETWRHPDKPQFVAGLAGLLDAARVRELEALQAKAKPASERLALDCSIVEKDRGRRLRFRCTGQALLTGSLQLRGNTVSGTLERTRLDTAEAAPSLNLRGTRQGRRYQLDIRRGDRAARLSDARMLERLSLEDSTAELVLRDDFAPVAAALERLRAEGRFAASAFSDALLLDLLRALGGAPKLRDANLPPPRADDAATRRSEGMVGQFRQHCGACHDTALSHPPNFLHGDDVAAAAKLSQCAERIYYRLAMWSLPEARRGKTPMPPLAELASHGYTADQWAASKELASLRDHATRLLQQRKQTPEHVGRQPFERLRACLPDEYHAAAQ